ncbi:MAG TPA: hypothetical protein VHN78_14425 [Chloroflexota bacterium]|nr:hypothetical protein [Chloroflexota bacterium]
MSTKQDTEERLDDMLDLQAVPSTEHWERIADAVRRLDLELGRPWRLKVLVQDTPEAAGTMPQLVAQLSDAGLRHDSIREPGAGGVQGIVVAPYSH